MRKKFVINPATDCELIVDAEPGFMPKHRYFRAGGNLPVPDGDKVMTPGNRVSRKFVRAGAKRKATRDAHPFDHCSFCEVHGVSQYTSVMHKGRQVITFKRHCVDGTPEAELHPRVIRTGLAVFDKGYDKDVESFDAFIDAAGNVATTLDADLKRDGIKRLVVWGLATEYCDLSHVLTALKLGYEVYVVEDACKSVDPKVQRPTLKRMREAGAHIIKSSDVFVK
jgi:nicotinamidase/pyrazinamidase